MAEVREREEEMAEVRERGEQKRKVWMTFCVREKGGGTSDLCFDVSVQDFPVVDVFESQADLDKPV